MHRILIGLATLHLGCAVRVGSGSLIASNTATSSGYVPKTRAHQRVCNASVFGVPVGTQNNVDSLLQRMSRGADGLVDIAIENENYFVMLAGIHCLSVTATPITTGGSDAQ